MSTRIEKYYKSLEKLRETPPGTGYHSMIFHVACCAKEAILPPESVVHDIRQNTVPGKRIVYPKEITDAVSKAYGTFTSRNMRPSSSIKREDPIFKIDPDALDKITADFIGITEADLLETSPIQIPESPFSHWGYALSYLYKPIDYLYVGPDRGAGGRYVKPFLHVLEILENNPHGLPDYPYLIVNPLTGVEAPCKDGKKMSFRADSCVADYRFCVVEFDSIPIDRQFAFWAAMLMKSFPVAALVHSGGKSVHGWIRVLCKNYQEWQQKVEKELFQEMLTPLGADRMCRNPSRMSRLPGHFRADKGQWQRLIYLNPEYK